MSSAPVAEVDAQLGARPGVEGRLFLFLSRGSEVYVVGPAGPRLLERRQATPLEQEQLIATAAALHDRLAAAGLDVETVQDRLNRRSVDLIPEWRQPPGADVGELRRRVDERLHAAGLGGLRDCIELARQLALDAGLAHVVVTSDIRHIDIGLTGKSDTMRAMTRALITGRRRRPQDLLVLGDTFGAVSDGEGTDAPMLIPELRRAVYVSVGAEPNGVPPGVLAGRRRPGRIPRHPARPAGGAGDRRAAQLPRAHRRRRVAVRGPRASTRSASVRSRPGSRSRTARPARAAPSRRARRSPRRPRSSPASTATGPAIRPSVSPSPRPTGPASGSWSAAAR